MNRPSCECTVVPCFPRLRARKLRTLYCKKYYSNTMQHAKKNTMYHTYFNLVTSHNHIQNDKHSQVVINTQIGVFTYQEYAKNSIHSCKKYIFETPSPSRNQTHQPPSITSGLQANTAQFHFDLDDFKRVPTGHAFHLKIGDRTQHTLRKTNIAMENEPFEDVFPIENGDIPLLLLVYQRVVQ